MLRKAIGKKLAGKKDGFQLRGNEIFRIEAFSDAVFAFAVTLLIVSLEVPKTFEELMQTIRGFFAFGVSFLLLMLIWYEQNVFFRRYGLNDTHTIALNCTLIFLVLFYVYPLKFLFTLLFSVQIFGEGNSPFVISKGDVVHLMIIYGIGFLSIYLLYFFMYLHAYFKRIDLELNQSEIFETKTKIFVNVIMMSIGLLSIIMALFLSPGVSGMVYFLIGPALGFFYGYRIKKKKQLL